MPNVLVRGVPDEVHAALLRKAGARHQSLQQYLTAELRNLAERRSVSEVLEEIDRLGSRRAGRVGFRQAVEDLGAGRSRR